MLQCLQPYASCLCILMHPMYILMHNYVDFRSGSQTQLGFAGRVWQVAVQAPEGGRCQRRGAEAAAVGICAGGVSCVLLKHLRGWCVVRDVEASARVVWCVLTPTAPLNTIAEG